MMFEGGQPVWIVTGTDTAGVARRPPRWGAA